MHQCQYPLSITHHCIPQQWKQPEALQSSGTADWLILQQRILGLFTTEVEGEWTEQKAPHISFKLFLNGVHAEKHTKIEALAGISIINLMNRFLISFPEQLDGFCIL